MDKNIIAETTPIDVKQEFKQEDDDKDSSDDDYSLLNNVSIKTKK